MKKILFCLLTVLSVSAIAGNTLITGFDAVTGIGTFKVVSDGTDATLTVDKLVTTDAITIPGGYVSNVVAQTASVAGTVTKTMATNTLIYLDASTNAATNIVIYVSNVTVTTPGVTTNVSVTYK